MRLLIVSFAPLSETYGAAQIALNLAVALRELGHEVITWSPGNPPPGVRWWRHTAWRGRELERFLAAQPPFDAIDAQPVAITRSVGRAARMVVARSVQPDLRYLAAEICEATRQAPCNPVLSAATFVHALYLGALVVAGWRRAGIILCLGSLEATWMRRHFPWWRRKLHVYECALAESERAQLAELKGKRRPPQGPGTRFLWIGRWTAHKGTRRLVRFIRKRTRTHPHDTFTIAGYGAGAEHDVPRRLVEAGRIRLIPSFTRSELFELLAAHDAGLFTSTVEGWGLTLNEMLESGMPVYATEAGGVRDLRSRYPSLLRPFPPIRQGKAVDPIRTDERGVVSGALEWATIAEGYEQLALGGATGAQQA